MAETKSKKKIEKPKPVKVKLTEMVEPEAKTVEPEATKVKMVEPAPIDDNVVEMITLKQINYLPPGSAIKVSRDKVEEYIKSGKAKRRN